MRGGKWVTVFAVVVIVELVMAMGGEAVNCFQVKKSLGECVPFLIGFDSIPSMECCSGVMNVKRLAPTVKDKRIVCECIKAAAGKYPNIKENAAASLPYKCGVEVNVPISRTTNCREIS